MKKAEISIVVPCYNSQLFIERCIRSLLNQSLDEIEIVAVNDGSIDNTADLIRNLASEDSRINLIEKENEGVSSARNVGMSSAAGNYVMFVDSDDWIEPETCEVALRVAEEEHAEIVMWDYIREYSNKSAIRTLFEHDMVVFEGNSEINELRRRIIGPVEEELAHPELADSLSPVWSKLYKRELISESGVSFRDLSEIGTFEDGLFNLHVLKYARKAVYVRRHFYHYVTNPLSITASYKPSMVNQYERLFDLISSQIVDSGLGNESTEKKALLNRTCLSLIGIGQNICNSSLRTPEKISLFSDILRSERYKKAFSELNLKYFPSYWKLFFSLAKAGSGLGTYLLSWLIMGIRKRR